MAAIGLCINGPMLSTWYKFLDKKFTGILPKLILDQTVFAPTIISGNNFALIPKNNKK